MVTLFILNYMHLPSGIMRIIRFPDEKGAKNEADMSVWDRFRFSERQKTMKYETPLNFHRKY